MRFHVVGLGSIGTLLAFHLRRGLDPKHVIHLVHKTNGLAETARLEGGHIGVEYNGVYLSETGFKHEGFEPASRIYRDTVRQGRAIRSAKASGEEKLGIAQMPEILQSTQIESLFVTTKAHAVYHVIEGLLPRLSPRCTIVLGVNGMGVYEGLVSTFFRNPETRPHFILMSNTHGAWLKRPGRAIHSGLGTMQFGIVPDPRGRDFEASMHSGGLLSLPHSRRCNLNDIALPNNDPHGTEYVSLRNTITAFLSMKDLHTEWLPMSELQLAMRRKLVANAVINPLTALMNCRNGELFRTEESIRILRRVCKEAERVFSVDIRSQPRGFETPEDPAPQGDPVPPSLQSAGLIRNCLNVAKQTAHNFSSMLLDIQHGRQTEIDYINGYLVKLGSHHRVKMGTTSMLASLIKMRGTVPSRPLL
ncbi:hypothetical protein NEOLEDRAFT_1153260 [Neolentinus lepideus HHB14362 ss-1]|uniref:2-dehydropantoate 2-reductase n=1 Tax=Neolentinus lepideus HHB14362 ss-1 TaxID=1314782 RepID=A0A165W824_9AGAM|nr:hypothetical protein NEOLEDRAFT_1153260 [Neolentinus lepideus HHB14362 ss-1]